MPFTACSDCNLLSFSLATTCVLAEDNRKEPGCQRLTAQGLAGRHRWVVAG